MLFFFFNDTATTEIYTLSLHDALPISSSREAAYSLATRFIPSCSDVTMQKDRKSTRLNSSHSQISYAVFCLKKKNNTPQPIQTLHFAADATARSSMVTRRSRRACILAC